VEEKVSFQDLLALTLVGQVSCSKAIITIYLLVSLMIDISLSLAPGLTTGNLVF
jgi:hypothetical protein